jgi:hypothetical protein
MSPIGYFEFLRPHRKSLAFEAIDLFNQHTGIYDHPIADHTGFPLQHTGGEQMENELLTPDHHGVPGIVAALKTDNHFCVFGEQIDNFAFAFISPLGADNYDIGHGILPPVYFMNKSILSAWTEKSVG